MVLETIALPAELYPYIGGEDGIRTHAAPKQDPNGLANRPLKPTWVLLPITLNGGKGGIRTHGPFRNHWFSRPAP